jgi:hypothetical protein
MSAAVAPVAWVHAFVDVPEAAAQVARNFWAAVTGWPAGQQWDAHPEFVSLEDPVGLRFCVTENRPG